MATKLNGPKLSLEAWKFVLRVAKDGAVHLKHLGFTRREIVESAYCAVVEHLQGM